MHSTKRTQLSRVKLAEKLGVALPTVDDWVRRGCPCQARGQRGKESEFVLEDVMEWRHADALRRRSKNPRDYGLEHGNFLRLIAQETAGSFNADAVLLAPTIADELTTQGLPRATAIRAAFYVLMLLDCAFEKWLLEDMANKERVAAGVGDFDSLFAQMIPAYKGTSQPPAAYEEHRDDPLPPTVQNLAQELARLTGPQSLHGSNGGTETNH